MTFRSKLLAASAITVMAAVGLDSFIVEENTRSAFEQLDSQRSSALVAQLGREFERRQDEVARRTERMAADEILQRIALGDEYSGYLETARTLAAAQGLDFVEITTPDGAIVSSAQWPARFGYKDEWVARMGASGIQQAALKREELPEEVALALVAVRVVTVGEKSVYIAGGQKFDRSFLGSLDPPEDMRVLLYRNLQGPFSPQSLISAEGAVPDARAFEPLVERVKRGLKPAARPVGAESFQAIPRFGRQRELLAILLIGSSRAGLLRLERFIRDLGLAVGAAGVLLGLLLAWWATARIARPVHELAEAAGLVAAGNWDTRVEVRSRDEIGELAAAFNGMTRQLIEQRERLVQSERVAAWRELARRLAHELKNPLFPMQITVENMRRAREQYPEQFDEVFREGADTLLAELANLKTILNRFSDFSRMPPPELQPVNVNEIVRAVMKLLDAQLRAQRVAARLDLDQTAPVIEADPGQLHRALSNLALNALDAMPEGGLIVIRTSHSNGSVRIEVSDTGSGLTSEECERLFTPYYTTKQHGTGLGLAIVQSVVSDHGGRISVESQPGRGATFRIELTHGSPSHH